MPRLEFADGRPHLCGPVRPRPRMLAARMPRRRVDLRDQERRDGVRFPTAARGRLVSRHPLGRRASQRARRPAGGRFVGLVDACHSATAFLGVTRPEPEPLAHRPADWCRLVLAACPDERGTGDSSKGGFITNLAIEVLERWPECTYADYWVQVQALAMSSTGVVVPKHDYLGPDPSLLAMVALSGS